MLFVLVAVSIVLFVLCCALALTLVLNLIAQKQEVGWLSVELHSTRENFANDAMQYEKVIESLKVQNQALQLQVVELRRNTDFFGTILGPTG